MDARAEAGKSAGYRGAGLHRPLIVLAVCGVGAIGYFARDFLIPTAAAVVLALLLTPVANALERIRIPGTAAAALSVLFLALLVAGLLSLAIPSIADWVQQAPLLTYKLERKLEGLRQSLAFMQDLTARVEEAATATANRVAEPAEKVVMRDHSLLSQLASTTPLVVLQIAYAGVLAFMLLAHRNTHRRQILRIPGSFSTRVRLARVMRDINERVGYYLFSLAVIYAVVAVLASVGLALLGLPNAVMWGAFMGLASFVPFVGPPALIAVVTVVALLTFQDWQRVVAVPALLTVIHFTESQLATPTFVSRRCALNTVAVFVAIGLLGWMWGPIGAIVAVPLLILISTISAHIPAMHWLEVLLADDQPVSPRHAKPPLSAPPWRPPRQPVRPARQRRRLLAAK
ncbi:Predicted PurR-regulated permease PerM [Enhydrobacter aerosaccus]|uniref:Predicted PurR-regulated permease PerM n=1 Tax=Enhydrobacter aerosaccus TaxID=225324 RepID=A0A1T4TC45_9HYPH|nr:AI-2E family transporter [Enhydrobacter aerosaccus]SKA38064.1 Predicted PurR-regulated permease PerM [Enhydrobacter aerosaccus]